MASIGKRKQLKRLELPCYGLKDGRFASDKFWADLHPERLADKGISTSRGPTNLEYISVSGAITDEGHLQNMTLSTLPNVTERASSICTGSRI